MPATTTGKFVMGRSAVRPAHRPTRSRPVITDTALITIFLLLALARAFKKGRAARSSSFDRFIWYAVRSSKEKEEPLSVVQTIWARRDRSAAAAATRRSL